MRYQTHIPTGHMGCEVIIFTPRPLCPEGHSADTHHTSGIPAEQLLKA